MSSHHFINSEKQNALIIADGEQCSYNLIQQLLEWNPFVVALDGAANKLAELDINFDAVLGDFDSINFDDKHMEFAEPFEKIHAPDQDFTDLEKAIQHLIDKDFKSINIIWATGNRADHTFNNIIGIAKYSNLVNIAIYDDNSLIYLVQDGFSKWYNKDTKLSFFPMPNTQNLSITNLVYPIDNMDLALPFSSSSNKVLQDGEVKITFNKGQLILMECRD